MAHTVACFVAHSDDESLGPGGTLARLAQEGQTVYVGALADGVKARYTDAQIAQGVADDALARRQTHFAAACRVLGAHPLSESGLYRDQQLDTYPLHRLTQHIELWLSEIRPALVLTHSRTDLNLDHRIVHDAVVTARGHGLLPGSIYGFQTISSPAREPFHPTLFYDVSKTLDTKARAIACYEDEIAANPSRADNHVRLEATRWYDRCGLWDVEAFDVIREIR